MMNNASIPYSAYTCIITYAIILDGIALHCGARHVIGLSLGLEFPRVLQPRVWILDSVQSLYPAGIEVTR